MKRKNLVYTGSTLLLILLFLLIPYWIMPRGSYCDLGSVPGYTVKAFYEADYGTQQMDSLLVRFGRNKELPKGYELEALLALSFYPELEDVKVRFAMGPEVLAPASSRPTVLSSFLSPRKRQYIVFIDTDSELEIMDQILINKMPFNARVGLLAHELGHSADYMNRNIWGMISVLVGNLSSSYMDEYEYQTDQCAIAHGAGHQLLAWSEYVHEVFQEYLEDHPDSFWADMMETERYMKPASIRRSMEANGY